MDYTALLVAPDSIAFFVVQGSVILGVLYAAVRQTLNQLRSGIPGGVIRGDKSWAKFLGLHGLLLVLMFQLISVAEIVAGYRVLLCLFNFVLATYLTLGNGWFRNWSLGWIGRIQKQPEH